MLIVVILTIVLS